MKNKTLVVALGGNAILQADEEGTYREQLSNVQKAVAEIVNLIKEGYRVVITHGNGPQVGNLYIQNSLAGEVVPPMPFDVCSAESQGLIGYFIQQEIQNELAKNDIHIPVVTLITQVLVESDDLAFKNPTKPIGPFHNKREADQIIIPLYSFTGYREPYPASICKFHSVGQQVEQDLAESLFITLDDRREIRGREKMKGQVFFTGFYPNNLGYILQKNVD